MSLIQSLDRLGVDRANRCDTGVARSTRLEKIMSKSNDTSKLGHAKLENGVLADSELAAVTGRRIPTQHKWADVSMIRALDPSLSLWAWR